MSADEGVLERAEFTDGFVTANGIRLHYLEWNPGGSEVVVMLHGLNVQAHTWDPAARTLAEDYRVLAFDLRGHGLSEWARDGYYIENFVTDIEAAVAALGLGSFHLVTHSLGCRVGIVFAARNPQLATSLVLSDTGPEVPREAGVYTANIVGRAGGNKRGFRSEAEAHDFYRSMHPEWQPEFIDLHAKYQLRENWAGKLVFLADPDLFWLTGSASSRDDKYVWRMLEGLTTPTLILWGTSSPFLNDDIADRMLTTMRDARLVRVEAGHYIPREAPKEFLGIVSGFLAEHVDARH
jgi:pimeloyl-ACP methyl ester carboxylesterase